MEDHFASVTRVLDIRDILSFRRATKRGGTNHGEDEEIEGAVESGGFVYG
jgi:hypothetical protein